MSDLKRTVLALAVAAAWTTGACAQDRVFDAIGTIDRGARAAETTAVGPAELARARAAGEMPAAEESADGVREYTVAHPPQGISVSNAVRVQPTGEAPTPALVNAGPGREPRHPQPMMSDAARAAEHMRYEASKKRRAD